MLRATHTRVRCAFVMLLLALACAGATKGQQTTAFTYQGRLTDAGSPANTNYDLQFTLWDSSVGGTQQPQPAPAALTKTNVAVTGGVFSVLLDFGVSAFPGADRFLEVGVRPNGSGGAFTILAPRQQISSTPYALRTLSATAADSLSNACVGCVTDTQINSVAASKLTGTIPASSVPSDSTSYIQNKTTRQSNATFNISGDGFIGGNVGIGTTVPSAVLSVVKSGAPEPTVLGAPAAMKVATLGGSVPLALRQNADESVTPTLAWFETANGGLGYLGASSSTFAVGAAASKQLALKVNGSTTAMTLSTSGNVGIGSVVPAHHLSIAGGPNWTTAGWAGAVELTNASAIGWQTNAAGNRFGIGHTGGGLFFFRTAADPGKTAGAPTYDLLISDSGNVGIGSIAPESKLHLLGSAGLQRPFRGLTIDQNLNSPGADFSGYSFQVRSTMNNVTTTDFIINTLGNVGIGTATPTTAKLVVNDTSNGTAVAGFSSAGSGVVGLSSVAAAGVYGESTSTKGQGVYGRNNAGGYAVFADGAVFAAGNAAQTRDKGGFVKAMALVKDDGKVVNCYNS